ncbi:MAG TPA: PEP/pyruvate-binding domain-containing protein, partial [Kiritimatiellia bacterium]|nr:PEP/pyruvate-binding domain-containing protein [Kiritimatiellia bacterium]
MVHKTSKQYVFAFGPGAKNTEGDASMRAVLGLRGANLAELSRLGVAVPPGFTIATEVCAYFTRHGGQLPSGLLDQVDAAVRKLESLTGMKFGEARNPLTVAVRCGAGVVLPGLMETVLNLGLNDQTVPAFCEQTGNARAGWDGYRLFMERFGAVVIDAEAGLSQSDFDAERSKLKDKYGLAGDADLSAGHLRELCDIYKRLFFQKTRRPFPQDPREQLRMTIAAGLRSWTSGRAEHYRQAHKVAGLLGAAVNVIAMVYGSLDDESGSGIVSSRDGKTGSSRPVGVFRVGAQGIGLSAAASGLKDIHDMPKEKPAAWKKTYEQLAELLHKLEGHYRYPQEVEFAVERGKLWILQAQNAQRSGRAAVRWALEMASGQDAVSGKPLPRVLKAEEALLTLGAPDLDTFLFPLFDAAAERQAILLARGQPLAPGAASGRIVFSLQKAGDLLRKDPAARLVLVCRELGEADRANLRRVQGVLAVGAGLDSTLAAAARAQGRG